MRAGIRGIRDGHEPGRPTRRRVPALDGLETLEARELLSGVHALVEQSGMHGLDHGSAGMPQGRNDHGEGEVRKTPQFYEFYVGPQRDDLNVVAASARFQPGKGLVLRGEMAGKIDRTPATSADDSFYVFGINRGSAHAVAPFFNRPGVVFDAVVVVSVTHDSGVSAAVVDLTTGRRTTLAAGSVKIEGREVRVTVDPSVLPVPAGGKPMSQWTFNLWPRSSLANPTPTTAQPHPSFVASFIPENAMAPIQGPGGHGHH